MTGKQKRTLWRIILSAVLTAGAAAVCALWELPSWVQALAYLPAYGLIGYDILLKACRGIGHGQIFDENFLMAVATLGAFGLGDFLEGVAVMVFYQIGELFQSVAVGRSRKNIAALMDLRPDYANVLVDGKPRRADPEQVAVGTEILVNPGEKIPIDGVIIDGETTLNTSALTGESVPRRAVCGDGVISGCINLTGAIRVRTTKEFGESTVSKILELVENSSMKKSRSESFITRFARYYTPAVCAGALALAVVPPLGKLALGLVPAGQLWPVWQSWIVRALTFLVISCPCALVISVPLSFFGGIGCASKNGILVKGSNYLEALASAGIVVFDKTGTLTRGVFQVTGLHPAEGFTPRTLLEQAALAESASGHPISQSLKEAYGKEPEPDRVGHMEEVAGHGVKAEVDGVRVLAGNLRLMEAEGVRVTSRYDQGTAVYVAVDGRYAGCITISDVIKPTAKTALAALKKCGVRQTVMLTGDSHAAARQTAEQLAMDEVRSELLPADKVAEVERLLEQKRPGEKLAFVGDGMNDAPVLSRADIGVAMGALGSDAAIEAADVVLMDDDPAKLALAMTIARRTLRIVRQNIAFALAVKGLCLLLGALGIANMWVAIFADVGVMVLAVLNATRALRSK